MNKNFYNCTDDGFCVIDTDKHITRKKRNKPKKKRGKIIYFADPMCSWCWGISGHISAIKQKYAERLDFEMVMGGLRIGGGEQWDEKLKTFLKHHWEQVQKTSGQPFNFDLLSWDSFNYDTEPACRAVRIIRDLTPEKEYDFYREIQYQFYVENNDPSHSDFYRPICTQLDIPFKAFRPLFLSSVYCETIKEDFKRTVGYGVKGFPTVILEIDEQQINIADGYTETEEMSKRIDKSLESYKAGKSMRNIRSKVFGFFSY